MHIEALLNAKYNEHNNIVGGEVYILDIYIGVSGTLATVVSKNPTTLKECQPRQCPLDVLYIKEAVNTLSTNKPKKTLNEGN